MKKIGIIGGSGPMASCQMYKMIIEECQTNYGCKEDIDFPEMVVINYPFAKMINLKILAKNKGKLVQQLQKCFDSLVSQSVEIIAIACNTLHTLLDEIVMPRCDFLNISNVTLNEAKILGLEKVLILATSTTIESKLYISRDILCLYPDKYEQVIIDQIITNVLYADLSLSNSKILSSMIKKYNVDGVVLGCTELSILYKKNLFKEDFKILDTLQLLVKSIVKKAVNRVKENSIKI